MAERGFSVRRALRTAVAAAASPGIRRALPGLLAGAGVELLHLALDGAEAWEALADLRPELLVADMELPRMDGGALVQRAIRNALMQAENVLLEPVCRFSLRVPAEDYGRVAGDLSRMQAQCDPPTALGEWMRIEGECPYRRFADYPETFRALTHGRGALQMRLSRYAPAADQAELVAAAGYNPLAEDTPDSVFCSHGAGHVVPWDEVRSCAHCAVDLNGL